MLERLAVSVVVALVRELVSHLVSRDDSVVSESDHDSIMSFLDKE